MSDYLNLPKRDEAEVRTEMKQRYGLNGGEPFGFLDAPKIDLAGGHPRTFGAALNRAKAAPLSLPSVNGGPR